MFAAFLDLVLRRRAVAAAIRAAQLEQQYEYRAAQRRIFEQNAGLDAAQRNSWDGPTRHLLVAPLMTPGQATRSRQGGRW